MERGGWHNFHRTATTLNCWKSNPNHSIYARCGVYPGLYTEVSRYVSWIEKSLQQLENKSLILWPRQSWCPLRSNECDGFIEISWEQCEKMTQTIYSLSTHVFQIKTGEEGKCYSESPMKTQLKGTKSNLENVVHQWWCQSWSKQKYWYQLCCRILSLTLYKTYVIWMWPTPYGKRRWLTSSNCHLPGRELSQ